MTPHIFRSYEIQQFILEHLQRKCDRSLKLIWKYSFVASTRNHERSGRKRKK